MSAPPYMKLYIADYLADTTHLSRCEHGAYLLLLMALWRAGGKLPRDPSKLARIAKCTPAEWDEIGPVVMEFFKVSGGHITQKRATLEIAKYQGVVKGSKTGGKASAAKRASKNNEEGSTDVEKRLNRNPTNQNHNQKEEDNPLTPKGEQQLDLIGEPDEPPADPIRQAFDQWNTLAAEVGLPLAKDLTEARRRSIGKRLEGSGLPGWTEALGAVKASAFCLGQTKPKPDHKTFKADLDFVCQAKSFQRLREGFYGVDAKPPPSATVAPAPNPDGPWRGRMIEWTVNRYWNVLDWGPKPGQPGCEAPAHLLKQLEGIDG